MQLSTRNIKLLLVLPAFTLPAAIISAHMMMSEPAPLKSKDNPHTIDIDYSYTSPLSPSGSDYPCKGYLTALGSSEAATVSTWSAGETHTITISGHASHNGGSCQIGLSVDGGQNFKTLHTYVGHCPLHDGGSGGGRYNNNNNNNNNNKLAFRIPADTPSSDEGILAWTWFNNLGNREMYMNCAVVQIVNGGDGAEFDLRPNLFRANTNGCRTVDSADVMIPNPGPDVTISNPDAIPPTGNCGIAGGDFGPDSNSDAEEGSGGAQASGPGDRGCGGYNEDAGYKPGNDWPEWFMTSNGWVVVFGSEQAVLLLGMLIFSICLHSTRPSILM